MHDSSKRFGSLTHLGTNQALSACIACTKAVNNSLLGLSGTCMHAAGESGSPVLVSALHVDWSCVAAQALEQAARLYQSAAAQEGIALDASAAAPSRGRGGRRLAAACPAVRRPAEGACSCLLPPQN